LVIFSVWRGRLIETFLALVREVASLFLACSIGPVDLGVGLTNDDDDDD
jgi:hypothetical protein